MIKRRSNISHREYRLSIFHSNKHIYAQIINVLDNKTLLTSSTLALKYKKSSLNNAYEIGEILAKKAILLNVTHVFFDRKNNSFKGQLKNLIEGARNSGLII